MSARLDLLPRYRPMTPGDLDAVLAIENAAYAFPWTYGNFTDSLLASYQCWVVESAGNITAYAVVMLVLNESHLLNLTVAPQWQRQGLGRSLLEFVFDAVRNASAGWMYLEVRPSNEAACALYHSAGFVDVARRRGYYPAHPGREDAIVMKCDL